ncbi:serine hydrolase [Acidobacteriota bacterium]
MKSRVLISTVFVFICVCVFSVWAGTQPAPSIEGHWEGEIVLPTGNLAFDIDFKKEGENWIGDVSIPVQNAKDLPLEKISVSGTDITFVMQGIPGNPTFKGALNEEGTSISGDFLQSGAKFPFTMSRGASRKDKVKKALDGFEKIVKRGLKGLKVPGVAMAVVVEDEIVMAEAWGFRDVEKEVPMTADTLMAIGSSSKAFTTFAMGALVDQGRLEWEAPVRNYIPWFKLYDPFASERMTPRDLVTHRSGLPRHDLLWYNNLEITREELVRRLAFLEPTADLRTRWQYNNLMFLTAGYLVETLTGKSWEDSLKDLVMDPLGMKRTNFSVLDSQKDLDFALPYKEEKGKFKRIPFRDITTVGPAGSINSSVREMAQWVLVHLNNGKYKGQQILKSQTVQDMHLAHMPTGGTPALREVTPADYGLGWFVDSYRGHQRFHHGGNIDGFSALVSVLPDDSVGFVVLTNMNGTPLPELLVRHASDLILGAEERNWIALSVTERARGQRAEKESEKNKGTRQVKGTKPAHEVKQYAGLYNHPGYGDMKVFIDGNTLKFIYNSMTTPLGHFHYETFIGGEAEDPTFKDFKITFRTDVNGRVSALETAIEPTMDPQTFQKKPDPRYFDPDYLKAFEGRYDLVGQLLTISLKGNQLALVIPGQPEFDLEPDLGGEFVLKQAKIARLYFKTDETGKVTGLVFIQGGTILDAKKIEN